MLQTRFVIIDTNLWRIIINYDSLSNDYAKVFFFFQLDVLKPVTWDSEVWNEGCVLSFIIESLEKFIFVDLDSDFWV
jgi:hypothetical protein